MGFMRKSLFVATGGLSGAAGVKANSKKDRAAKAAEKQLKLMKHQARLAQRQAAPPPMPPAQLPGPPVRHLPASAPAPLPGPTLVDELARLAQLKESGALTDEEFAAAKAKLLGQPSTSAPLPPPGAIPQSIAATRAAVPPGTLGLAASSAAAPPPAPTPPVR